MFQTLSDRLSGVLDKLTRRGALSESDVSEAMREVRRALLEADVALDVVKSFIERVKAKAVGADVLKSVTPGQMVVKIVHDELVNMLGSDAQPIDLHAAPPVAILMVGLQGSGKTTTSAKIAYRLAKRENKKVLMASLDVHRPAAQEQLKVLGEQTETATLPIVAGQGPLQIAKRAIEAGKLGGYDVVILDTAGRVTVDDALMGEVAQVKEATNPHEVLLVADSLTGQDAVKTAEAFDSRIGITGIVLTRADGDGRGGAALSMRAVTGKPIKLIGVGEKWNELEDFHPERIANRILGMGDVVSLVEKAAETIDVEKATAIATKMKKGLFDLEDLAEQLTQMQRMGGMGSVMKMLPGMGKLKGQLDDSKFDDKILRRQHAIISSMTPKERRNPKVLNAKRKRRVAAGSGTKVEEINKLLKMHRQMADFMKTMGRKGLMGRMMGGLGGGGGGPSEAEMAQMQADLAGLDPKALEQLPDDLKAALPGEGHSTPGGMGAPQQGLPGGLPGLAGGGSLPGLGGGMPSMPGMPGMPGGRSKRALAKRKKKKR